VAFNNAGTTGATGETAALLYSTSGKSQP